MTRGWSRSHKAGKKEDLGIPALGSKAISASVISGIRPPDSPSKFWYVNAKVLRTTYSAALVHTSF